MACFRTIETRGLWLSLRDYRCRLLADHPQVLLYCFSGLDHEVADASCSLLPPAACYESTSCWANTHCLNLIVCAISLLAAQLSAAHIISQLFHKAAHVYHFVNEDSFLWLFHTLSRHWQEDQGWKYSLLEDQEEELDKPLMNMLKLPHIKLLVG